MRTFDLVIIGTGSGNSILDPRFKDWNVAVVEKGTFGGTCLNVGCIPTKMFVHTADLAAAPAASARLGVDSTLDGVRWEDIRDRIFGRIDPIAAGGRDYRKNHADNSNVTVFEGTGRFTEPKVLEVTLADGSKETITAPKFVLAAGGRVKAPDVPGLSEVGYETSDTIMRLAKLPKKLTILGSGFIAAEFAHVFSSYGVDVTVIARSGALLRSEDDDISSRFTALAREKWDVRLDRKTVRAERDGDVIRLHLEGPSGAETVESDVLLVAVGRTPNSDILNVTAGGIAVAPSGHVVVDEYQRTTVDGVYALGDISSPYELKHVANHEARVVQHNLLHPSDLRKADHRFVPSAVFTSPQIASVGLTEREAKASGRRYVVAEQAYADIAYGWAMEDTSGFVKLLADPASGELIGAHIMGPQASSVIQPLIQAMSFGLRADDMARGQYWIHPGMPEVVENALLKLVLD
ncbi:mycothione reductase [Kibdelosporangium philippinense]|uniref:Mycothione reductase n=1 Tax=Kibdelosporangium philippinense TaxID=211113 RepID=A0ABS8ZJK8_9PSEU|nr:mycothione reductase [Kibdelosporangium philippinense]MCE7007657.1 mycothione reductase [Kibdelosporangium philippinense]